MLERHGSPFYLSYPECLDVLARRISEPAPGRIQLLSGPRQVGKTTLLLELARDLGSSAIYEAADGAEASLPGFWERLWDRAESAAAERTVVVLLDEVQLLSDWSTRLKAQWDRLRRRRIPVHIVASGSSALRLATGSRESLAGRFERVILTHWSARSLADVFGVAADEAVSIHVRAGSYPGALPLLREPARWTAYVREAIVEPAVGRDILALGQVRRPALLRQVFGVAASSPGQILSLQKLQGRLQDRGALETIAHYLGLLEDAYLIAALPKHSPSPGRRRSAPPKLVSLSNAFLAVVDPRGAPDAVADAARFGAWVENACLAHAWNSGQRVAYWREEPLEVDGVLDGDWGSWAIEVTTGAIRSDDLRGLAEFVRRHRRYVGLVLCEEEQREVASRLGFLAIEWRRFLLEGPPRQPDRPPYRGRAPSQQASVRR